MAILPPIKPGDRALSEAAKVRPGLRNGACGRRGTREAFCPHCGRRWTAESWSLDGNSGRVMGFLVTAANNHERTCASATPEERRAIARLDMRRWALANRKAQGKRMAQRVEIAFDHPGFGGQPIFDDPAFMRFGVSI